MMLKCAHLLLLRLDRSLTVDMLASYTRAKTVSDAIILSATKLGVELKEKQREALLNYCLGRDVFVSLPTGYGESMIFGLLPVAFNILNGGVYILCISD